MRKGDPYPSRRENAPEAPGPQGSVENIPQEEWRPVVRDIVTACKEALGTDLAGIYTRGALSSGEAPAQDDVDLIVLTRRPKKELPQGWLGGLNDVIMAKYPFVDGVDISIAEVGDNGLPKKSSAQFFIKTQGVCVDGLDVKSRIREFIPGRDTRHYSLNVPKFIETAEKELDGDERTVAEICKYIMNKLSRAAYELVAEKEGRVRHEVVDCYEGFSKYYPEKEAEMREMKDLYLNPTNDASKIRRIIATFGPWLMAEIQRVFPESDSRTEKP